MDYTHCLLCNVSNLGILETESHLRLIGNIEQFLLLKLMKAHENRERLFYNGGN